MNQIVRTRVRTLTLVLFSCLALAVIVGGAHPAHVYAAEGATATLVTSGRAEVQAAPDMAKFSAGVDTRALTVEEAREANARIMNEVQARLLEAGADEKSLKTRAFSVNPEWQYNPSDGTRTLVGYVVSHSLEVMVTDLDILGTLLDTALQAGANQLSGPTFGLSNQTELEAQALTEAIRRARAKAEVMARASGVFLKRVVHINEHVNAPFGGALEMQVARASFAMDATPTSISPGEISVTATVNMTFEI